MKLLHLKILKAMKDRSQTIGSSEISAIMGLNRYMTPIDVWKRKTGRAQEFEGNAATERGLLLEPVVAQWWAKESGNQVQVNKEVFKAQDVPCSATPDYFYWLDTEPGESMSEQSQNGEARGILEIKTTRFRVIEDDVPQSWFLQAQYQAAIVNRFFLRAPVEEISLAWLDGDLVFGHASFKVNAGYGAKLLEFTADWWGKHVIADVMPDPENHKEAAYKWPNSSGAKIEASKDLRELVRVARILKKEIAEKEKELDWNTLQIKEIMQEAEAITFQDELLCTWKTSKERAKFDEKAFKAEHEELYQKFCKTVSGNRVFLLK